jgi:hypothetical protein
MSRTSSPIACCVDHPTVPLSFLHRAFCGGLQLVRFLCRTDKGPGDRVRRRWPGRANGERLNSVRGRLTPRKTGSSAKPILAPAANPISAIESHSPVDLEKSVVRHNSGVSSTITSSASAVASRYASPTSCPRYRWARARRSLNSAGPTMLTGPSTARVSKASAAVDRQSPLPQRGAGVMGVVRAALTTDAEAMAQAHVAAWQTAYRGLFPQSFLDALDAADSAEKWRRNLFAGGGGGRAKTPEGECLVLVVEDDNDEVVGLSSVGTGRGSDEAGLDGAVHHGPTRRAPRRNPSPRSSACR